jgi:Putative DNA-binding domain
MLSTREHPLPPSAPAELAQLQRGFLALATGGSVRSEHARAALAEIEGTDARESVVVYRRMYALRMQREVAREFPATHALLGDGAFGRVARAYVAAHPSRSFTLEGYAAALPEFLQRRSATRAAQIAAIERDMWRRTGTRVRVGKLEATFLRALLKGVGLERAVAAATRSGLDPDGIRRALEHWMASGLLELRYRSDPWSIQAARCPDSTLL